MPPAPTNVYMSADQTGAVGFAGGYWWNNNANAWATIQTAFPAYHSCMIRAVEGPAGPSPTALTISYGDGNGDSLHRANIQ